MAIRFYNTLTRKKEVFEPLRPPDVGIYACGPTVYNYAHIGNLRTFLFEDILRRHLTYRGYRVTHVMNITDVEDKIIRACRQTGQSREELTHRYIQAFFEDLDVLGALKPHHTPKATEHIREMVELIQQLMAKGYAYRAGDSIYFRLTSFSDYGKLSHFDVESLEVGASGRVDSDEYETENAKDFALWKGYDEDDGDVFWETPIGKGRPGWHIECSAMSMKYLGETFDIHCGGVDLIFPHHENEIAQAEACTGKPFVKYWLHAAHLNIDGKKISKSLGNVITLRDLLERGHDPRVIRWALCTTHYRQPSNFSEEGLASAKEALQRIWDFRRRLQQVKRAQGVDVKPEVEACEKAFCDAMDDDLNISAALAVVFEFIRQTNKLLDDDRVGKDGVQEITALLDRLHEATGLFPPLQAEPIPEQIIALVEERAAARRHKNFARADEIRAKLLELGWIVEDTPNGPNLKKRT
ncbi:MAG TPA: cysteine--tRNA ligase [Candidatus Hydrogenedentes bacterium]|nr:cysteine--tRNA ligase [Candidatus Hydrogenedentota bacterium]HOL77368.1 cysteine--tRNA ligase [Candidatus Hydrogenedentota bacterium]HPO84814.1 cysteine--tRNA ligase [Candidatus Hydrogenedentota bacterium]